MSNRGPGAWESDPQLIDLLRRSARAQADAADREALAEAAAKLTNWQAVPDAAEAHGLAPLLHHHLTTAGVVMPTDVHQRLFGLAALHRDANRVRFRVLGEILDAFDIAGISALVLKGAALAHLVYPASGLRPMSDIDLLVHPEQAALSQSVLAGLGFSAPPSPEHRRLASHHHLPAASTLRDGQYLQVEIHTNALSRDVGKSLSFDQSNLQRQPLLVEGRTAYTLGHVDMLYHLCRHTAERASLLRLIWIADVVGYAARYRDAIAWEEVRERHPFVLNALSLLHLVTPLPTPLLTHVTPARGDRMRGIGIACRPLGEVLQWDRPLREIGRDLFAPSEWWMRLYYGVDSESASGWHRWVTHPLHVGYWLVRRANAYAGWWAAARSSGLRRLCLLAYNRTARENHPVESLNHRNE